MSLPIFTVTSSCLQITSLQVGKPACVCVWKSVNGTLEKLAQLSRSGWDGTLHSLATFAALWMRFLCPCLFLCLCCLPCSSNMTARKGSQGAVGSRRGWLQQCNTKYYKQAELAKSSAKLLPNSSIRSKQGILLFLLHVCGNPASRNSHLSLPCLALLVKSNLLHTFVRRSKTATKCIRPARQLQLWHLHKVISREAPSPHPFHCMPPSPAPVPYLSGS